MKNFRLKKTLISIVMVFITTILVGSFSACSSFPSYENQLGRPWGKNCKKMVTEDFEYGIFEADAKGNFKKVGIVKHRVEFYNKTQSQQDHYTANKKINYNTKIQSETRYNLGEKERTIFQVAFLEQDNKPAAAYFKKTEIEKSETKIDQEYCVTYANKKAILSNKLGNKKSELALKKFEKQQYYDNASLYGITRSFINYTKLPPLKVVVLNDNDTKLQLATLNVTLRKKLSTLIKNNKEIMETELTLKRDHSVFKSSSCKTGIKIKIIDKADKNTIIKYLKDKEVQINIADNDLFENVIIEFKEPGLTYILQACERKIK